MKRCEKRKEVKLEKINNMYVEIFQNAKEQYENNYWAMLNHFLSLSGRRLLFVTLIPFLFFFCEKKDEKRFQNNFKHPRDLSIQTYIFTFLYLMLQYDKKCASKKIKRKNKRIIFFIDFVIICWRALHENLLGSFTTETDS